MRHPKNPFSSGEPGDDDALVWPRERREVAAETAPGRGGGAPAPLPRRTGDSGFRPHGRQGAPSQDFWPLTDPDALRKKVSGTVFGLPPVSSTWEA